MVCIDTEHVATGKKVWIQVWWELVLSYCNAIIFSEEDEGEFAEGRYATGEKVDV